MIAGQGNAGDDGQSFRELQGEMRGPRLLDRGFYLRRWEFFS